MKARTSRAMTHSTQYQKRISICLSVMAAILLHVAPVAAQTYTISPSPFLTALDDSGNIIVNGCIWTYAAGTSTPIATYSSNAGALNSNPIIADYAGRFTAYLLAGTNYKFAYESACSPPSHGTTMRTADNIAGSPGAAATVDVQGTAGETLSAGQCAYLSDGSGAKNAGQYYKCDSANTYSSTSAGLVGLAPSPITIGATGAIRIAGLVSGLSSLSPTAEYYAGTSGAVTSTAPTNHRPIGIADTSTSIVVIGNPGYAQLLLGSTNGQIVIGSTGAAPVIAALTQGAGVQITNAAGSITIANGVLDRQVALTTVVNSVTETAVYTYAVPANTLSTNRTIHLSLIADYLNNSGGALTYTVRVKYGATTIFQLADGGIAGSASRSPILLDVELTAANATGAQRAKGFIAIGNLASVSGVSNAITDGTSATNVAFAIHNAVAEDSTASKNLVVTFQMSGANAAADMRAHTVYTEVK